MSMTASQILSANPKELALLLKSPNDQAYPVALYRCAQLNEWELFKKWLPYSHLLGYGVKHLLKEEKDPYFVGRLLERYLVEELNDTNPQGDWLDCVASVDRGLFHKTLRHLTRWECSTFNKVHWNKMVSQYHLPSEVLTDIALAFVVRGQRNASLEAALSQLGGRLEFNSLRHLAKFGYHFESSTTAEQDRKAASVINQLPLGSLTYSPILPWLQDGFLMTAMSISDHLSFYDPVFDEKKWSPRSWSSVGQSLMNLPRYTSMQDRRKALQYVLDHCDITKLDHNKDTAFIIVNCIASWHDELRCWFAEEVYKRKPILVTQKNNKGKSLENGGIDPLVSKTVLSLFEKDKMLKVVKTRVSPKIAQQAPPPRVRKM